MWPMKRGYLLLILLLVSPFSALKAEEEGVQWKRLYHQLFVWNILEEGSVRELNEDQINHWIQKSIYYSPEPTSDIYYQIVNSEMSRDAFRAREKLLGDFSVFEENFLQPPEDTKAKNFGIDKKAEEFFKLLVSPNSLFKDVDYFQSTVGKAVLEHMKDYLFVVVPGFGSHTMQEFSYAYLVEAANSHYGRPLRRPREKQGNEVIYEDPKTYYGKVSEVGFDVVHPMGSELGNSMGDNENIANFLAEWIRSLPEAYKDKKLILFGYSKGAPIAHHVVQQHEDIRNRTRMIITVAGVTQGTSIAQSGLEKIEKLLENKGADANSIIGQLSMAGPLVLEKILPLLLHPRQSAPFILEEQVEDWKRFFEVKNMAEVLDGARSMTPYERVKWNMRHVNKENFSNIAVFNLSVLTNIKDLLLPGPISSELGPELPTQIMPNIDPENPTNLDWKNFSIDNLFLYSTSIAGFEESAGGLFDTQVGWMDTKSMAIDFRPLSDSLSEEEIKKLETELAYTVDASIPRKELIKEQTEGLDFIDLGELRGTHWDLAFRQVYKPDERISEEHYVHTFPRSSFLNALLETLTLYKIMNEDK